LGAVLPWEFEIGQPDIGFKINVAEDMTENSNNVIKLTRLYSHYF